jgi:PAS domain S-box-containing protein
MPEQTDRASVDPASVDPVRRPLADASVDDEVVWAMIDAAPDGTVLCDSSGRILFVNGQVETMFGHDRAELLGQDVDLLLPESLRVQHRDHRIRYVANPSVRAMGPDRRLMARRKDGSEFAVEIALSPVNTSGGQFTVATVRDITDRLALEAVARDMQQVLDGERQLADAQLRAAHSNAALVTAAINESEEGVAIVDLSGAEPTVQFVNSKFIHLRGLPVTDVPPGSGLSVLDVRSIDELRSDIDRLRDGDVLRRQIELPRPDGATIQADLELQRLQLDHNLVLVRLNDATGRLAAEEARRSTVAAEALSLERERVARDLHDTVVQQLFATGLTLQASAGRSTDPEISARLNSAVDEIDAAIRQLRTAIFASKSPRSADGRASTYLTLLTIVDEAGRMFPSMPTVSIDHAVDNDRWRPIHLDLVAALRECLANVARHAKATGVTVNVSVRNDHLELTVEDDGVGAPEVRPVGGNGLANLAERAVQHGGTFTFEPRRPNGSRARWSIPAPDAST